MAFKGSILIVDDELGPRESLRFILKPIYEVYTAANGYEALRHIQSHKVDLVTLDLKMPGIPGIQVLREIKKSQGDIEVIIITGYGTLENAIEAIRYGAADFISKPFNIPEIISSVHKTMQRHTFNLRIRELIKKINHPPLPAGQKRKIKPSLDPETTVNSPFTSDLGHEIRGILKHVEDFRPLSVSVNFLDFLKVLICILENKESYTKSHSERVCFYSEFLAQDLHLAAEQREDLQIATLLHDIGKIGLSNSLLEKSNLEENESFDIRQHPLKGVHIIEPLGLSHHITAAIRHHHERWDGKGYPDGLFGEDIPLFARIISLADSYDAMTSNRPYRHSLSAKEVRGEIERNAGVQFDPHMAFLFSKHFKDKHTFPPFGQMAEI